MPRPVDLLSLRQAPGFTLIEVVVGIVLVGTIVAFLQAVIYPQFVRSVNPLLVARAAELSQSLAEEILAKPYDELTPVGGNPPCNPCTAMGSLGLDGGETGRVDADDVDDYDGLYCAGPTAVENALGLNPADYDGFRMQICVTYDGNYDGVADANENAKLISIDVWPPFSAGGDVVSFNVYRGNF